MSNDFNSLIKERIMRDALNSYASQQRNEGYREQSLRIKEPLNRESEYFVPGNSSWTTPASQRDFISDLYTNHSRRKSNFENYGSVYGNKQMSQDEMKRFIADDILLNGLKGTEWRGIKKDLDSVNDIERLAYAKTGDASKNTLFNPYRKYGFDTAMSLGIDPSQLSDMQLDELGKQSFSANPFDDGSLWSAPVEGDDTKIKFNNQVERMIYEYMNPGEYDPLQATRNQMTASTKALQDMGIDVPNPLDTKEEGFTSRVFETMDDVGSLLDISKVIGSGLNAFSQNMENGGNIFGATLEGIGKGIGGWATSLPAIFMSEKQERNSLFGDISSESDWVKSASQFRQDSTEGLNGEFAEGIADTLLSPFENIQKVIGNVGGALFGEDAKKAWLENTSGGAQFLDNLGVEMLMPGFSEVGSVAKMLDGSNAKMYSEMSKVLDDTVPDTIKRLNEAGENIPDVLKQYMPNEDDLRELTKATFKGRFNEDMKGLGVDIPFLWEKEIWSKDAIAKFAQENPAKAQALSYALQFGNPFVAIGVQGDKLARKIKQDGSKASIKTANALNSHITSMEDGELTNRESSKKSLAHMFGGKNFDQTMTGWADPNKMADVVGEIESNKVYKFNDEEYLGQVYDIAKRMGVEISEPDQAKLFVQFVEQNGNYEMERIMRDPETYLPKLKEDGFQNEELGEVLSAQYAGKQALAELNMHRERIIEELNVARQEGNTAKAMEYEQVLNEVEQIRQLKEAELSGNLKNPNSPDLSTMEKDMLAREQQERVNMVKERINSGEGDTSTLFGEKTTLTQVREFLKEQGIPTKLVTKHMSMEDFNKVLTDFNANEGLGAKLERFSATGKDVSPLVNRLSDMLQNGGEDEFYEALNAITQSKFYKKSKKADRAVVDQLLSKFQSGTSTDEDIQALSGLLKDAYGKGIETPKVKPQATEQKPKNKPTQEPTQQQPRQPQTVDFEPTSPKDGRGEFGARPGISEYKINEDRGTIEDGRLATENVDFNTQHGTGNEFFNVSDNDMPGGFGNRNRTGMPTARRQRTGHDDRGLDSSNKPRYDVSKKDIHWGEYNTTRDTYLDVQSQFSKKDGDIYNKATDGEKAEIQNIIDEYEDMRHISFGITEYSVNDVRVKNGLASMLKYGFITKAEYDELSVKGGKPGEGFYDNKVYYEYQMQKDLQKKIDKISSRKDIEKKPASLDYENDPRPEELPELNDNMVKLFEMKAKGKESTKELFGNRTTLKQVNEYLKELTGIDFNLKRHTSLDDIRRQIGNNFENYHGVDIEDLKDSKVITRMSDKELDKFLDPEMDFTRYYEIEDVDDMVNLRLEKLYRETGIDPTEAYNSNRSYLATLKDDELEQLMNVFDDSLTRDIDPSRADDEYLEQRLAINDEIVSRETMKFNDMSYDELYNHKEVLMDKIKKEHGSDKSDKYYNNVFNSSYNHYNDAMELKTKQRWEEVERNSAEAKRKRDKELAEKKRIEEEKALAKQKELEEQQAIENRRKEQFAKANEIKSSDMSVDEKISAIEELDGNIRWTNEVAQIMTELKREKVIVDKRNLVKERIENSRKLAELSRESKKKFYGKQADIEKSALERQQEIARREQMDKDFFDELSAIGKDDPNNNATYNPLEVIAKDPVDDIWGKGDDTKKSPFDLSDEEFKEQYGDMTKEDLENIISDHFVDIEMQKIELEEDFNRGHEILNDRSLTPKERLDMFEQLPELVRTDAQFKGEAKRLQEQIEFDKQVDMSGKVRTGVDQDNNKIGINEDDIPEEAKLDGIITEEYDLGDNLGYWKNEINRYYNSAISKWFNDHTGMVKTGEGVKNNFIQPIHRQSYRKLAEDAKLEIEEILSDDSIPDKTIALGGVVDKFFKFTMATIDMQEGMKAIKSIQADGGKAGLFDFKKNQVSLLYSNFRKVNPNDEITHPFSRTSMIQDNPLYKNTANDIDGVGSKDISHYESQRDLVDELEYENTTLKQRIEELESSAETSDMISNTLSDALDDANDKIGKAELDVKAKGIENKSRDAEIKELKDQIKKNKIDIFNARKELDKLQEKIDFEKAKVSDLESKPYTLSDEKKKAQYDWIEKRYDDVRNLKVAVEDFVNLYRPNAEMLAAKQREVDVLEKLRRFDEENASYMESLKSAIEGSDKFEINDNKLLKKIQENNAKYFIEKDGNYLTSYEVDRLIYQNQISMDEVENYGKQALFELLNERGIVFSGEGYVSRFQSPEMKQVDLKNYLTKEGSEMVDEQLVKIFDDSFKEFQEAMQVAKELDEFGNARMKDKNLSIGYFPHIVHPDYRNLPELMEVVLKEYDTRFNSQSSGYVNSRTDSFKKSEYIASFVEEINEMMDRKYGKKNYLMTDPGAIMFTRLEESSRKGRRSYELEMMKKMHSVPNLTQTQIREFNVWYENKVPGMTAEIASEKNKEVYDNIMDFLGKVEDSKQINLRDKFGYIDKLIKDFADGDNTGELWDSPQHMTLLINKFKQGNERYHKGLTDLGYGNFKTSNLLNELNSKDVGEDVLEEIKYATSVGEVNKMFSDEFVMPKHIIEEFKFRNQIKDSTGNREAKHLLNKVMKKWKTAVLATGSKLLGDEVGNFLNSIESVGFNFYNPKYFKPALQLSRAIQKGDMESLKGMKISLGGVEYTGTQLSQLMRRYGLVEGASERSLMSKASYKNKYSSGGMKNFHATDLRETKKGSWNPLDDDFIPETAITDFGSANIDVRARAVNFFIHLDNGLTPTKSAILTNKALFDFTDMTEFETNTITNIAPFYRYLKLNTLGQMERLSNNSGAAKLATRMLRANDSGMTQEEEYLRPDYMEGYIDLGNGKQMKSRNPITTGVMDEKDLLFSLNPLAKLLIQTMSGHDLGTGAEIAQEDMIKEGIETLLPTTERLGAIKDALGGDQKALTTLSRRYLGNPIYHTNQESLERMSMKNYNSALEKIMYEARENPSLSQKEKENRLQRQILEYMLKRIEN